MTVRGGESVNTNAIASVVLTSFLQSLLGSDASSLCLGGTACRALLRRKQLDQAKGYQFARDWVDWQGRARHAVPLRFGSTVIEGSQLAKLVITYAAHHH